MGAGDGARPWQSLTIAAPDPHSRRATPSSATRACGEREARPDQLRHSSTDFSKYASAPIPTASRSRSKPDELELRLADADGCAGRQNRSATRRDTLVKMASRSPIR